MTNNSLNYFDKLLESNNYLFRGDTALNLKVEELGSFVKDVDYQKGVIKYSTIHTIAYGQFVYILF